MAKLHKAWVAALLFLAAGEAASAVAEGTEVTLDQATGYVTQDGARIPEGEYAVVPPGKPLVIRVVNTNTALFTYTLQSKIQEAPQLPLLNSFLAALTPYVPQLLGARDVGTSPLAAIDEAVFGEAGILKTQLRTEEALREMSRGLDRIAPAAARMKASLPQGPAGWDTVVDRLLAAYARLPDGTKEGNKALQDSAKLLEAARRVELNARQTINASAQYSFPSAPLPWDEGRTVRVRVTPSRQDPFADYAANSSLFPAPERDVTILLAPRWPVRVGLGGAFLVSPGSTWEGPSGTQDGRFTWGVTLSLAPRALTPAPMRAKGWAIWLPELTLNPTSSDRALGAGAALGWKALKLGIGALWTRHETPEGDQSYGSPKLYLSLSVTGWEPFKAE